MKNEFGEFGGGKGINSFRDLEERGIIDLISKLESLRTLIIYDSPYVLRSMLFYDIIPYFLSKNKEIYLTIFTDTMERRLAKSYQSILKIHPEIAKLLEQVKIIKVGTKKSIYFGKLHAFITINQDWWKLLKEIAKNMSNDDVMIFHGYSTLPILWKDNMHLMMNVIDAMPDDITLICKVHDVIHQREKMMRHMDLLYDLIIKIKKEHLTFDDTYLIGIYESVILDIKPETWRFKINKDGKLIKIE